jgi:hypothetical protein
MIASAYHWRMFGQGLRFCADTTEVPHKKVIFGYRNERTIEFEVDQMKLETCPKCSAMMQEVHEQLLVPEQPADSPKVTASVTARMVCPECRHAGEPYIAGQWTGNRPDLPAQTTRKDDMVQRIHRTVKGKHPDCHDYVHYDVENVQLEIIQDGKRWNFALGPANAIAQMSDDALENHIWQMKRIAPVTYSH